MRSDATSAIAAAQSCAKKSSRIVAMRARVVSSKGSGGTIAAGDVVMAHRWRQRGGGRRRSRGWPPPIVHRYLDQRIGTFTYNQHPFFSGSTLPPPVRQSVLRRGRRARLLCHWATTAPIRSAQPRRGRAPLPTRLPAHPGCSSRSPRRRCSPSFPPRRTGLSDWPPRAAPPRKKEDRSG